MSLIQAVVRGGRRAGEAGEHEHPRRRVLRWRSKWPRRVQRRGSLAQDTGAAAVAVAAARRLARGGKKQSRRAGDGLAGAQPALSG